MSETRTNNKSIIYCFTDNGPKLPEQFDATIQGKVVKEKDEPLVNVKIECGDFTTITDKQGNFVLKLQNAFGELNITGELNSDNLNGYWLGSETV